LIGIGIGYSVLFKRVLIHTVSKVVDGVKIECKAYGFSGGCGGIGKTSIQGYV